MNPSRRRLLVEQIVVVAVLECGMKVDAMWHVPQLACGIMNSLLALIRLIENNAFIIICLEECAQ